MDLKNAEKQIDNADSFLDKLWKFFGKHWGKLLIILSLYGAYKFFVLVGEEMNKPKVESSPVVDTVYVPVDPVVTEEYHDVNYDGDSIIIRTWSDGIVDTIYVNN